MSRFKAKCECCRWSKTFSDFLRTYCMDDTTCVPVQTSFGFCADCEDLVQMEEIPSLENLNEELAHVESEDVSVIQHFDRLHAFPSSLWLSILRGADKVYVKGFYGVRKGSLLRAV